jgi:phenylacetic acid degradation operon negative regulatory protein
MPAGDGRAEALQPQDLVLTIFGAHVRDHEQVWSGGMVEVLGDLGFSSEATRAALARLVGRDLLARHKEGRLAFYTLTERAEALLADGDDRIWTFGREAPSDVWTVVWHAIPENRRVERSRFASRLRFLGFGSIQDATWLAAHDRSAPVEALAHALGIEDVTTVLVGGMPTSLPAAPVVRQAWALDAVADRYDRFLESYGRFRRAGERRALTPQQAFATRIVMLHRFRAFPAGDPELPDDLDGLRRRRAEVVKTFDAVYAGLEAPATRYFTETARVRAAAG